MQISTPNNTKKEKGSIFKHQEGTRTRDESNPNLNNRHLATKHKHNAHLKKHTEGVPYIVSIKFLEALSAITTLKKEGLAHGSLTQFLFQAPGLPSKHNGREGLEGAEDRGQLLLIWVLWELQGLLGLPAAEAPFGLGWKGGLWCTGGL